MKFEKLTLIAAAMLSVSAVVQATVNLSSEGDIRFSRPQTKIRIPKGSICGPNGQNCLNNDIELWETAPFKAVEDHFNFDRWPGKFKEVKSITWDRVDPKSGKTVKKCKTILSSKVDRDNKKVQISFTGDNCSIAHILNEKQETGGGMTRIEQERLDFVTLEWNEAQKKWNYFDLHLYNGVVPLTSENIKGYEKFIPQEAKDLVEGKK